MIFKEVVKGKWINMDNVACIEVDEKICCLVVYAAAAGTPWRRFGFSELKDTPEHWRNWLRERS